MPFVKLDCGILDSTLWIDRDAREMFITALLMAKPATYDDPVPEIAIDTTEYTGWTAPPGNYGFVPAASLGICNRAGVPHDVGMAALVRLSQPEAESRTRDHEGRRMVRIDGGFLILNFAKYRAKDQTAAERSARYRQRQREKDRHAVASRVDGVTARSVTEAEAEAEANKRERRARRICPPDFEVPAPSIDWARGQGFTDAEIRRETERFKDYEYRRPLKDWNRAWRNWIRKAADFKPPEPPSQQSEAERLGLVRMAGETDDRWEKRIGDALTRERYGNGGGATP